MTETTPTPDLPPTSRFTKLGQRLTRIGQGIFYGMDHFQKTAWQMGATGMSFVGTTISAKLAEDYFSSNQPIAGAVSMAFAAVQAGLTLEQGLNVGKVWKAVTERDERHYKGFSAGYETFGRLLIPLAIPVINMAVIELPAIMPPKPATVSAPAATPTPR